LTFLIAGDAKIKTKMMDVDRIELGADESKGNKSTLVKESHVIEQISINEANKHDFSSTFIILVY